MQAVNATGRYFASPYGPSGAAPNDDIRNYELYFERLEKAGLGNVKRPDLLIFQKQDLQTVEAALRSLNGVRELPFTDESDPNMRILLQSAIIAVECENSLWRARKMPDYHSSLKPQKRLGGRLGLKKSAVTPTVILKEEDRKPLWVWQEQNQIPIHIWHAFFDEAYGVSLTDAERLIRDRYIEPKEQIFQSPGGAVTKKVIYKIYRHYAYPLAETVQEPELVAESLTDNNGHILPYVRFAGGKCRIEEAAMAILDSAARQKAEERRD